MRVCHMSSAHESHDVRIFLKECVSLSEAGHEVYLVARGKSREEKGVHVIGLGDPKKGRMNRMFIFSHKVFKRALELDCDVYHLHDPELLQYIKPLKKAGKKVIFDSHEDVAAQIMDKPWIPGPMRKFVSMIYHAYETKQVKSADAVVAATRHIGKTFGKRAKKVVIVNNYPRLDDIRFHDTPFSERKRMACYAGVISEIRGKDVMIDAMKDMDAELALAGPWEGEKAPGGSEGNYRYLGKITRDQVNKLYGRSMCGLVLYQPARNHYEAQPTKMFEYMAAGLPFVAADYPLWKGITESSGCGICVDPADVYAVREAIKKILNDTDGAQEMGRKGREAAAAKYSWAKEEKRLTGLYEALQ